MSVDIENEMKFPYQDQHNPFDEYFPERNALELELEKLNQIVKAQRSSDVWKKFNLATTSSTEYGGKSNYTRKQTPRTQFFNPWYQSSREIGKYNYLPQKKRENDRLNEILEERKSKKSKEEHHNLNESVDNESVEIQSEAYAFSLPPIQDGRDHIVSAQSDPIAAIQAKGYQRKPGKFRDPATNFQFQHRGELRTGVKDFMDKPMGRLMKNMNELPKDTGSKTRISPKVNRNINRSIKHGQKLSPLNLDQHIQANNKFGLGNRCSISNTISKGKSDDEVVSHSIPSMNSKGSSL